MPNIHLSLADGVTKEDVLAYLNSPEVQAKYGLRISPGKCIFASYAELCRTGMEALGSWVGGGHNVVEERDALTAAAANRLKERLQHVDDLPRHHALNLLRKCWYPGPRRAICCEPCPQTKPSKVCGTSTTTSTPRLEGG